MSWQTLALHFRNRTRNVADSQKAALNSFRRRNLFNEPGASMADLTLQFSEVSEADFDAKAWVNKAVDRRAAADCKTLQALTCGGAQLPTGRAAGALPI